VTRIERFASRADAELARTVLQSNGIPAYVSGDDAGGLHPEIPYGIGGTAVIVPEERYADAIALLDEELGEQGVTVAELEAAAMAAGPAESSFAGSSIAEGAPDEGTDDWGAASTRRSGTRRPSFLLVVVVMLIAVLVSVLFLSALDILFW
jgi:hypothetical protein